MTLTQPGSETTRKNPEVFSRGALELTFRLLRSRHPSLALSVQNILAGKPLPGAASDQFHINLDARTVGRVVAALTDMGEQSLHSGSDADQGRRVVISTLIREWMTLAEWIIIRADKGFSALH